jgi:hypothetical protein
MAASVHDVNNVEELTTEQYASCLHEVNDQFCKRPALRHTYNLQEFAGPSSVEERGAAKAMYCGNARRFKYYSHSVFCKHLGRLGQGSLLPHAATERQFMDSLAMTSLSLQNTHIFRSFGPELQYRGPQV